MGNLRIPREGWGRCLFKSTRGRGEIVEDRAFRPVAAVTALGEIGYDLPHRGEFVDFAVASIKTRSLSQRVT